MQRIKRIVGLWRGAFAKWNGDNASVSAAAIAFFSGLSLAPLLVFGVLLASLLLQGPEVQQTLLRQAQSLLGTSGRQTVEAILANTPSTESGLSGSLISLATLVWSASILFGQFQTTLNRMWRVPDNKATGLLNTIILRARALLGVLITGVLLLLTALISVLMGSVRNTVFQIALALGRAMPMVDLGTWTRIVEFGLPLIDVTVSLVLLTLLFTWIFTSMPRTKIGWRDVRGGAIWTALLFIVGKWGLAWYLGSGAVGSAYGAAGALLVVLVWVYYTAQIVLLGVAYSYVDTHAFGSRSANEFLELLPAREPELIANGTPAAAPEPPCADAAPPAPAAPTVVGISWWVAAALFFIGWFVGARDTRGASRGRRPASS